MSYQNTGFNTGTSTFVDVNQNYEITFASRKVAAKVGAFSVPMVKAAATLRASSEATACGSECPLPIVESVKIEFSVTQGAASLEALRAELTRLVDKAISDFHLTDGLVPPVFAAFAASPAE